MLLYFSRKFSPGRVMILAPLLVAVLVTGCERVDLGPEALKSGISGEMQTRGRELLARAQAAHRLDLWRNFRVMELEYADEWPQTMPRVLFMPWPENHQKVRLRFQIGTDNARLEFLEGPNQDEVWGIQNWVTYREDPSGSRHFEKDGDTWFWLPTYAYFAQLPYRIAEGDVIADVGAAQFHGRPHERVFVTWNSPEPSDNIDQYIVWIDRESGLINLVEYTVRDMGASVKGEMHYSDYRAVEGIPIAFRQAAGDRFDGDTLHQMQMTSVRLYSDLNPAEFVPEPTRRARKSDRGAPVP